MAITTDDLEASYAAPPARRPRRTHQPAAVWLALLCGLIAMGGFLVLTNDVAGTPVAVAARDLAAGETVGPGDFSLVAMAVPPELAGRVLGAAEVNAPGARVTVHALGAGDLVQRSDLADATAAVPQRAMSIPVDPSHAAGGALRVGDLIDVVDASGAEPAYVLTSARVLAVSDGGGGRLGGGSSKYSITVAVDATSALRLAATIEADKFSVVRSTGAPAVAVSPPTTAVRR